MVKTGIDRIDEYRHIFDNKRVGLITNPTGVNSNLESTVDILNSKLNLVALFSPEHGIRGDLQAGVKLETYIDPKVNKTVYTLYGNTRKPSKEMMDLLDILVFDIQDVGARFYTYLYTMSYAMMACKEHNKKMVVFDRPNPVNGIDVEGNILNIECRSFVGYYPLPQRYGLTIGELAYFFNKEYDINCDLEVIPLSGWNRSMTYQDTKLDWIYPSPNIPFADTTFYYLATCVFEGTNLSEGRGTAKPFHMIGSPYLDAEWVIEELRKKNLPGVRFRNAYFTPTFSKHQDQLCNGIELLITDVKKFEPVKTGYIMLDLIRNHHKEFDYIPPFTKNGRQFIDYISGDTYIRENSMTIQEILDLIEKDSKKFKELKQRYHLYE
jgi:uncharacterized protein YbbC (DUF1343 family)